MRDVTMLRASFLEWASDRANERPGPSVDLDDFMAEHNVDLDLAFQIVRSCVERGWVNDVSGMGHPSVFMTLEGMAEVQAQNLRRDDPVARSAAARTQLLTYLYRRASEGANLPIVADFVESSESMYEGQPFPMRDVERAAAYLKEKGLLDGISAFGAVGPIRAQLTAEGIDCVEDFGGDVRRYLAPARTVEPSADAVTNVHAGTVRGVVAGPNGVRSADGGATTPRSGRYSGKIKVTVCRRLGSDWSDLADFLEIPPYSQGMFPAGGGAREVWRWLQDRDELNKLPSALRAIGRGDLAELLERLDSHDEDRAS